jgi:hypothetical protein
MSRWLSSRKSTAAMTETSADKNLLTQKAIKSNLVVQNALTAQAARLEAQLKELDELIVRGRLPGISLDTDLDVGGVGPGCNYRGGPRCF